MGMTPITPTNPLANGPARNKLPFRYPPKYPPLLRNTKSPSTAENNTRRKLSLMWALMERGLKPARIK